MKQKKPARSKSVVNRKTAFVMVVLIAVLAGAVTLPARKTPEPANPAAQTVQSTEQTAAAQTDTGTVPEEGRLFLVGDSRTIDIFADSDESIEGAEYDGVVIYAGHGCSYYYLEAIVDIIDLNKNDTLVTWMGANDWGNFSPYRTLYERLLKEGVRLILCTVGPTGSDLPVVWEDEPPYNNSFMLQFNTDLRSWAATNNVPVIDLYSYVERNVEIDLADGVHYLPRPNPALWEFILEKLRAFGAL